VRVGICGRVLLSVAKDVNGKFQCAARSEEAAVEDGERESAGLRQLEAGASKRTEPLGLDMLLARSRVEERLGFVGEQGAGFRSWKTLGAGRGAGPELRYPYLD